METTIKKVQDYFKKKLMLGEFEVLNMTEFNIIVSVGSKVFNFWIANERYGFKQYLYDENFIDLSLTEKDKDKLYNIFLPTVEYIKNTRIREEKTNLFNSLKAELGIL